MSLTRGAPEGRGGLTSTSPAGGPIYPLAQGASWTPAFAGEETVDTALSPLTLTTVIPAKAGIQRYNHQRKRLWIPAFAGMTIVVLV